MQKITTFLTFNDQAEEAANLYTSIFKNATIGTVSRYGEGGHLPAGTVMSITFQLDGHEFIALNGGPHFTFSDGTSFLVSCETQEEIDGYWDTLCEGGKPGPCGWLKDKFGVSWQIVPSALSSLLQSKDGDRGRRVMQAMMKMAKLDIAALEQA